ncbi:amino acid ABC transporter permease [Anaeromicropila populeti]|uniref:Amino acid ABC transporter membrane protein 1, PAAT family (TC 3.A.1.3.-) n=1 Tax=Anaeromicropila populeti TaxID=37658 RepID=A0A1I6HMH8_9FIRM|nr:amino acid ABC transporter permease [Anaeromicropila populeti]SFR55624.1 amino acid ABC transporter membrane protein 1, PAAT family (TC 3.A.1.3.-) [Anaeromicropila populeti]
MKIMIEYFPYLVKALPMTFYILFTSVFLALILALFLTWAKVGKNKIAKAFASVYISFMRGTPIIAQLLIVFIAVPLIMKDLGIRTNNWNNSVYAITAFALNEAAFFAEIFRSAYIALDKGQIEAGQSLGMSGIQVFLRIILPQAGANALPNTTNMTIELMKNTSLGMAIGVYDIMGKATQLALNNYGVGQRELFFEVSIMFWMIGLGFMFLTNRLVDYLNRGTSEHIGKNNRLFKRLQVKGGRV